MSKHTSSPSSLRHKVVLNFGLFFLFFAFYLMAAVIQTPLGANIAYLTAFELPLGLLLSLLIFPVSWLIMGIWFWRSK
jgi:hypothetical protein